MRAIDVVYFQEFINQYRQSQEERASKDLGLQYFGPHELQLLLNKIPTIDAEPVRHGRWIDTSIGTIECSECGHGYNLVGRFVFYCPHCGAKMDLKEQIKYENSN